MSKQSVKAFTIEEYELCNKLKSMRFSGMAAELERVFAKEISPKFWKVCSIHTT